jgi:hypothetical protein
MLRKTILMGITVASALAIGSAQAKTIRIAEHRQARIDALKKVVPDIEKKYNVHIEVVEYPWQRHRDYWHLHLQSVLHSLSARLRFGRGRRDPCDIDCYRLVLRACSQSPGLIS